MPWSPGPLAAGRRSDHRRRHGGARDIQGRPLAPHAPRADQTGGPDGPYRQSDRKDLYRQYADQLIAADKAYYAFDTSEELEAMRERLKAAGSASPAYNAVTREHMKNSLTLSADEVKGCAWWTYKPRWTRVARML